MQKKSPDPEQVKNVFLFFLKISSFFLFAMISILLGIYMTVGLNLLFFITALIFFFSLALFMYTLTVYLIIRRGKNVTTRMEMHQFSINTNTTMMILKTIPFGLILFFAILYTINLLHKGLNSNGIIAIFLDVFLITFGFFFIRDKNRN